LVHSVPAALGEAFCIQLGSAVLMTSDDLILVKNNTTKPHSRNKAVVPLSINVFPTERSRKNQPEQEVENAMFL
jgi:hypothetical protein